MDPKDPFDLDDLLLDYDASFDFTPAPDAAATTSTCISCSIELSNTLDAYYGRDAYEAEMCSPCRDGRRNNGGDNERGGTWT